MSAEVLRKSASWVGFRSEPLWDSYFPSGIKDVVPYWDPVRPLIHSQRVFNVTSIVFNNGPTKSALLPHLAVGDFIMRGRRLGRELLQRRGSRTAQIDNSLSVIIISVLVMESAGRRGTGAEMKLGLAPGCAR
jgi:hypothetical protein